MHYEPLLQWLVLVKRRSNSDYPCRNTYRYATVWHIRDYDRIQANNCMVSNSDSTNDAGSSRDIHMTTNNRSVPAIRSRLANSNSNLIENQAVGA
jgi:hypothetical protein